MPIYEYRCQKCNAVIDSTTRADAVPCEACGHPRALRRFSFSHKPDMPAHFNPSTGTYVNNEAKFRDDLKRASDAATERTGITHNFTPTDPRDMQSVGATSEGLKETYDRADDSTRKVLNKYLD